MAGAAEATVTIVVVAHSVRDELERCFSSLDQHAGVPIRTILVDNGSTDETLEWVGPHIRRSSSSAAVNIGIAAREHGLTPLVVRYTMFLDSDAELTQGALPAHGTRSTSSRSGGSSGRGSSTATAPCSPRPAIPAVVVAAFSAVPRWAGSSRTAGRFAIT